MGKSCLIALETFFFQTGSVGETRETGRAGCSELALCELLLPGKPSGKNRYRRPQAPPRGGRAPVIFSGLADQLLTGDDGWVRRVCEAL